MRVMVAPNGVGIAEEDQARFASPPLLWTLANIAGALVRAVLPDPQRPQELATNVVRNDDVAIVWQLGPWILHGSDLRHGTLSQFFEMCRRSRAKSGMAAIIGGPPGVLIPKWVMSLLALDEGIPVGVIVQYAGDQAPLPMMELSLPRDVQSMWLTSVRLGLSARVGEPVYQRAISTVAEIRAR